jgi:glucose/mannose-6-phosphate isomerase
MLKQTNALDKENLRQVILDFPAQFEEGLKLAKNISVKGDFKSIEISGMGGSSLPANILRVYLGSTYPKNKANSKRLAIFQNRFYSLPPEAYDNSLNFFASYSGNTEETVSSLKEAIKHKLPSIGLATGGKILELCQKNNIPCVILPTGIQPRYATGYFFAAMFQILVNLGLIEDKTKEIIKLAHQLETNSKKLEGEGKKLAKKLVGKTPVIYASPKYKSVAMIWKIKMNENAKTPAFYNFYPELNHNEMVGYSLPQGKFHIINLLDKEDHPQNIKRMQVTAKILKKKGISSSTIEMQDSNIFNTIFTTLLLGDWTSYYLALEYNQDPTPVDMVEDLKKQLA